MSNVTVQKIDNRSEKLFPALEEIEKRFEEVRRRAFDFFEGRGRELGHSLDDSLKAEHEVLGLPAAQLKEKDPNYELQMTLPGFEPNEVQVTVTPSDIIVHAQVKPEKKAENAKLLWTEFGSNGVYRRFEFPEPIDMDKISAKLDKGMLVITATKRTGAPARSVEVQAA